MEKKRVASIVGIIAGAIMVIIGFSVMGPKTLELGTRNSYGSLIGFGADFYTEMYAMTYQVANAVQRAYTHICNAIGWLIVVAGVFDICYFSKAVCEAEDSSALGYTYGAPAEYGREQNKNIFNADPPVTKANDTGTGTWVCENCKTENCNNYGQCKKCGKYRG